MESTCIKAENDDQMWNRQIKGTPHPTNPIVPQNHCLSKPSKCMGETEYIKYIPFIRDKSEIEVKANTVIIASENSYS